MEILHGFRILKLLMNLGTFLVVITVVIGSSQERVVGPKDYCYRELFNVTCNDDEVIIILQARFGRMKIGRCVQKDLGFLGCYVDVTEIVSSKCSARRNCVLNALEEDAFFQGGTCSTEITRYLEVTHKCMKVHTTSSRDCHNNEPTVLKEPTGFISALPDSKGHTGHSCPWEIKVQPGQKVNLTLYSFVDTTKGVHGRCYKVASVIEYGLPAPKPILSCADSMESPGLQAIHVYTSVNHEIKIELPGQDHIPKFGAYLLEYRATECPHISTAGGAVVTYSSSSSSAKVECSHTGQVWYLTCKGTKWIGTGEAGNCTGGHIGVEGNKPTYNDPIFEENKFPYGLLIAVAIGVALGVFCGGMLLTIVVVHKKRKQRNRAEHENIYYGTKHSIGGGGHYCAEMNSLRHAPCDVTASLTPCPAHRRMELARQNSTDILERPEHHKDFYMKPELIQPQQPDLFLLDKNATLVKDKLNYGDSTATTNAQFGNR